MLRMENNVDLTRRRNFREKCDTFLLDADVEVTGCYRLVVGPAMQGIARPPAMDDVLVMMWAISGKMIVREFIQLEPTMVC